MLFENIIYGQFQYPLASGGYQPGRDMEQPGADGVGFLAQCLASGEPGHPDHEVVGQDAGLEEGGVSPEVRGADAACGNLIFRPFDQVFAGGTFAITLVDFPGGKAQIGHVAKELVDGLRKQETLGFLPYQYPHG